MDGDRRARAALAEHREPHGVDDWRCAIAAERERQLARQTPTCDRRPARPSSALASTRRWTTHLALGREAAHEERVEAAEQVPVEVAQIVARRVRAVRLDLEARRLRAAGEATVAGARAHAGRRRAGRAVPPVPRGARRRRVRARASASRREARRARRARVRRRRGVDALGLGREAHHQPVLQGGARHAIDVARARRAGGRRAGRAPWRRAAAPARRAGSRRTPPSGATSGSAPARRQREADQAAT